MSGGASVMDGESGFRDGWWRSADGLQLHYRDYSGGAGVPAICLPGLTRNARDFDALARRLASKRRVIAVDLRGRGQSEYAADPASYVPPVYAHDIAALLDTPGLERAALIGTSLGGIIAMLLGMMHRDRLAGVLLNDVGPVIEADGLARIAAYVGAPVRWPSWAEAGAAQRALHGRAHPGFAQADWEAMARRLCREEADGAIVPDYDPAIAIPFAAPPTDPAPDAWPLIDALRRMPGLIVRGALSDILSVATAKEMAARLPDFGLLTVAETGHAPMLDEPGCDAAIDAWLARVDAAQG